MSPEPVWPTRAARATAGNLRVDHSTAELLRAFEKEGVGSLLVKGASIARWLYADGEPRPYWDCDVLLNPSDLEAARNVLGDLGYVPALDERQMPEWWREHSTGWLNEEEGAIVDLHRRLQGIWVDPERAWSTLSRQTDHLDVAGFSASVLSLPARALYVALHAAHHGQGWVSPQRDLERALEQVGDATWKKAAVLAAELDAVDAFATGLQQRAEGTSLAHRLGLRVEASVEAVLRNAGDRPEALTVERVAHASGVGQRLDIVWHKLFPPATFMRSWSRLARRGPLGLGLAYLVRPVWVIAKTPPALLAWRRGRRQLSGTERTD